jgi:hypothetical protein
VPTEDEIRRLRYPQPPAWDEGPSSQSLADDISRWYENAGGLDRAIDLAQQAGAKWRPEDIYKRRPVTFEDSENVIYRASDKPVRGSYDPATGKVRMTPGYKTDVYADGKSGRQAVLEHERSHGALGVNSKDDPIAEAGGAFSSPGFGNYVLTPDEMTVRLAQIKRRYAHETGEIVDTPEKAQRALYWYFDHAPQEPKGADYDPSGYGTVIEYLHNPAVRKKAAEMMPKVVDTLIERLGQG